MHDGLHNAKVESTNTTNQDHGCLMFWLMLDYGGVHQGFGGYALDAKPKERKLNAKREPTVLAGLSITKILEVTGAPSWETVPGSYIRADVKNGLIEGIVHLLNDSISFYPKRDFAPYLPAEE